MSERERDRDRVGHPGAVRALLGGVGIGQAFIGAWALVSPRDWFEQFPGVGHRWLALYGGGYDGHLAFDVGATFCALGVLLIVAAISLRRSLVTLAVLSYLTFSVPHAIYHLINDTLLPSSGEIGDGITVTLTVVLPLAALVVAFRGPGSSVGAKVRGAPASAGSRLGELRGWHRGVAAIASLYGRMLYRQRIAPSDVVAHRPVIAAGYGAFEIATVTARRVDYRLKLLAVTRASALVSCEWCMDFCRWRDAKNGITAEMLVELSRYRESSRFSDVEKLVLDYAGAMSGSPARVGDDLVQRLREHFDDPQMVELTSLIALENYRSRFNNGLGIAAQDFADGVFCVPVESHTGQTHEEQSPA